MVGLQFDMSVDDLVRESLGEDPKVIALRKELREKYPKGDCATTDVSIKKAQELLSPIYMEKAGGKYKVDVTRKSGESSSSYTSRYKKALADRKLYVDSMSYVLRQHLDDLEADFKKNDCRNQFEKTRIQDMASTLTKGATKQEESILKPNYKEQYVYIGIGATVLLLGLYLVTKK